MSSYTLPAPAFPPTHHHHGSAHVHSHSRPSSSLSSLNRSFRADSNMSVDSHHHDHDHDHGHSHGHSHAHNHSHSHKSHGHSHHRANSNQPIQSRSSAPRPLSLHEGWTSDSTAGGKPLVTPTNATFAASYDAPQAQSTELAHDHSAERSAFTNLLLPHTSKWPLLHSVMTEKDSRRIFYFMRYGSGTRHSPPDNSVLTLFVL